MTPLNFSVLLLSIVTAVFAAGCIAFRTKGKAFEGMLCKFMASFGFISVAVVGYGLNPVDTYYFGLVCFALLFGFFGDVLLGIKEIAPKFRGKLIPLGTLYFLAGHVFYVFAFAAKSGFEPMAAIVGALGAVFSLAMMKILKMKINGKLKAVLVFYYGILVCKVAAAQFCFADEGSVSSLAALVGSVLFLISDSCLSLLYFTPVKKKNRWVAAELTTYYSAQILLALSVAFMQ